MIDIVLVAGLGAIAVSESILIYKIGDWVLSTILDSYEKDYGKENALKK